MDQTAGKPLDIQKLEILSIEISPRCLVPTSSNSLEYGSIVFNSLIDATKKQKNARHQWDVKGEKIDWQKFEAMPQSLVDSVDQFAHKFRTQRNG